MSNPVLSRVDLFITRDKSAADRSQIPLPSARVEFYGQGATVADDVTVPGSGSEDVDVYDPGDLEVGSTLRANGSGPELTVTAITTVPAFPGVTQVTLSNGGASDLDLTTGMRLIITSNRPTLYSDPLGTVDLGNPYVTADNDSRVLAYINRRRYDYTIPGKVYAQVTSNGTLAGGNVLSWNHNDTNITAPNRMVLVGISWQGSVGGETIDSVTYGGVAMSLVGQTSLTSVYKLANPPTGLQTVVANFGASSPPAVVYAVGGAVTYSGVDALLPLGSASTATGTSTAPSVGVGTTYADGLVFDTMSAGGTTTASAGSGQTPQWNQASGGITVRGCGSLEDGTGSSVTMSWTLGTSRPWGILGVGLKPALRIHVDALGGTQRSPSWLNARDFESIQVAIDTLPPAGGVVYIPGGEYEVFGEVDTVPGLLIPPGKAVHLLGDGADRTIIFCSDKNVDVIWVQGSYSTIENLTIRGVPEVPDGATEEIRRRRGRGIVVGQVGGAAEVMRRISILGCRIIDTASWCLFFLDEDEPNGEAEKTLTIWVHVERCEFRNNIVAGVLGLGKGCFQHLYVSCGWEFFRGFAVSAIGAEGVTFQTCTLEDRRSVPETVIAPEDEFPYVAFDGCKNIRVLCCWFESHATSAGDNEHDTKWRFINVGPTLACEDVTVDSCRFVRHAGNFPRLMKVKNASKAISLINPTCTLLDTLTTIGSHQQTLMTSMSWQRKVAKARSGARSTSPEA